MRFRPVKIPTWEITDLKEVAPIPVHYDSDEGELSISLSKPIIHRTVKSNTSYPT